MSTDESMVVVMVLQCLLISACCAIQIFEASSRMVHAAAGFCFLNETFSTPTFSTPFASVRSW